MLPGQNDAANLRNITRDDIMKLFMERIHPSSKTRSKLSIHLRSQASPSPKFSVAASRELLPALQSRGIEVKVDDYHKLSAAEPSLANIQAFWSSHFKTLSHLSQEHAKELLLMMETLTRTHPSEAESDSGVVPPGAQYIRDVASFKAGLTVSKAASPVEIYNDLATSKL
jgi:insulysin